MRHGAAISLRHEIWQRLAAGWKPPQLEAMAHFVDLAELPEHVDDILAGRITGRVVVKIAGEEMYAGCQVGLPDRASHTAGQASSGTLRR